VNSHLPALLRLLHEQANFLGRVHGFFGARLFLTEQAQNHLRRSIEEIGEGRRDPREEEQGRGEPARERLWVVECRCLGCQLAKDDVEVGDDDERQRCAKSEAERNLDRKREVAEHVGENVANRRFGDPSQAEARQCDTQLASR